MSTIFISIGAKISRKSGAIANFFLLLLEPPETNSFLQIELKSKNSVSCIIDLIFCFRYAKNQLRTYPQVMNPPANMQLERNPDEVIITQVREIVL